MMVTDNIFRREEDGCVIKWINVEAYGLKIIPGQFRDNDKWLERETQEEIWHLGLFLESVICLVGLCRHFSKNRINVDGDILLYI